MRATLDARHEPQVVRVAVRHAIRAVLGDRTS